MLAKNYAQILEFLILKCSFGPERLPGLWRNRPLDHYRQIYFGVIDPVTVAQYIPSRSDRQDVKIYHTKELSVLPLAFNVGTHSGLLLPTSPGDESAFL